MILFEITLRDLPGSGKPHPSILVIGDLFPQFAALVTEYGFWGACEFIKEQAEGSVS